MTYKKLFTITYNNKDFMLFLDENNRKTFLEINDSGEYEYPNLEDFIALNKIYNYNNPFICYNITRFKFKECVKQVKNGVLSLLTVLTLINSIPSALAGEVKYEVNDKSVVLSYEPFIAGNSITITDTNDLEKYLGEINITEELIIETVNNNNKIPEDIKQIIIDEFKRYYKEHPSANYRVFYENMKVLEVVVHTEEEYRKEFSGSPGSGANFSSANHRINLIEGYSNSTLRHELAHTNQTLFLQNDGNFVMVMISDTALNEGMTDIVSNNDRTSGSYFISSRVVQYLMDLTGYTFEDYSRFNTKGLIDRVNILYPDIDLGYISESLNAMVRTEISEAVQIKEDNILMYDELFEICLKNIKKDNGYKPLLDFISVLNGAKSKNLVAEYYKKYNEELKRLGYFNILANKTIQENIQKYAKANAVIYNSDNDISFGYVHEGNENEGYKLYKIDSDGRAIEVKNYGSFGINNFDNFKLKVLIEYPNNIEDGIKKIMLEEKNISPHTFMSIPIYLNGELLTTANINKSYIQIAQTHDNKVGYIITDNNGKIIYETEPDMSNLSNPVSMTYYILNYGQAYISSLDLNHILNEEYLKTFQIQLAKFSNLEVINNNLNFIRPVEIGAIPEVVESKDSKTNETITGNSITSIYANNELIAECLLKDLYLSVGKTKDGKIGYTLTNKSGLPIYESSEGIEDLSNPINFEEYTGPAFSKTYLEDYLNDDYLRNFQQKTKAFYNLKLAGENVIVDATPTITIISTVNDREIRQTYKISKCRVYIGNGSYIVGGTSIMPEDLSYEQSISIEELMRYYDILDNSISVYQMTSDYLGELINNYLKDANTKGR